MITKEKIIRILRNELPYLRDKYGVKKIAIFGSFTKDLQRKRSDIDILVELKKTLGLDFVELAYYLENILGKKVDLATFDSLKSCLKSPRYKHIAEDIKKYLIYV